MDPKTAPLTQIPPATGLMVFARRSNQIDLLLSGLSNQDEGIRVQTVKTILRAYYQQKRDITKASETVNNLHNLAVRKLTESMVNLAETYNWQ